MMVIGGVNGCGQVRELDGFGKDIPIWMSRGGWVVKLDGGNDGEVSLMEALMVGVWFKTIKQSDQI